MTSIRHLIIAGSNKCGTTSLFRYLSDHPAVCGSSEKETGFFHKGADYECSGMFDNYMKLFPDPSKNHDFYVEATPTYLDSGRVIADRIEQLLDKPVVLLMLRDPTDRMVSYYRSKQGIATSLVANLSFNEFVDKAITIASGAEGTLSVRDKRIGNQIEKAHYARFLEEYLQAIPASQMRILFFEDMRDEPLKTTQAICHSIGLNSGFYDDYTFHVENRSRIHRSSELRKLTMKVNAAVEPILNRVPYFRRSLRSLYDIVNTTPGKGTSFDAGKLRDLREHFRPHNESLRTLLQREFDIDRFPDWLSFK